MQSRQTAHFFHMHSFELRSLSVRRDARYFVVAAYYIGKWGVLSPFIVFRSANGHSYGNEWRRRIQQTQRICSIAAFIDLLEKCIHLLANTHGGAEDEAGLGHGQRPQWRRLTHKDCSSAWNNVTSRWIIYWISCVVTDWMETKDKLINEMTSSDESVAYTPYSILITFNLR